MMLSLAFLLFHSALHSAHGQEATSLRGNVVKETPASTMAGGVYVDSFRLLRAEEQVDTRIIGGSEAIEDRFSYAAYLPDPGCTGSLIARDVVLTAAHCTPRGVPTVILGKHNVVFDGDGEEIAVRELVPHPDYGVDTPEDNDFMLVFLENASAANEIITVKLNSNPLFPSVGQDVTVMGWGDTNIDLSTQEFSEVLMNVEVNIISNEECEASEGTIGQATYTYNGQITENMMCAKASGKDSCQGDSGGPVIIRGEDGNSDLQVGVVSWGLGCAFDSFPGVYAQVSRAYDWIQSEVCEKSGYASEAGFDCGSIPTNPPIASPTNPPVVVASPFPTNPPVFSPTNPPVFSPTYPTCTDTIEWVDSDGYGCDWYATYDSPGCPFYGTWDSTGMGAGIAKDNCCFCMTEYY